MRIDSSHCGAVRSPTPCRRYVLKSAPGSIALGVPKAVELAEEEPEEIKLIFAERAWGLSEWNSE